MAIVITSIRFTSDSARPCQLLENCFNPSSLSAGGGSGAAAPKIGDVMYADKTWGSAENYDGSKQAVGIVSAVGNDGSVKIISLKDLTFSSSDSVGNFDPDDPYGGTIKYTQWATDDEANTNIIDLPEYDDKIGVLITRENNYYNIEIINFGGSSEDFDKSKIYYLDGDGLYLTNEDSNYLVMDK